MDDANLPPLRPPPRPRSPQGSRSQSTASQASMRSESSLSSTSEDSSRMPPPMFTRPRATYLQEASTNRPSTSGDVTPSAGVSALQAAARQANRTSVDGATIRMNSPGISSQSFAHTIGQRSRQHSQGYFEPSLSHMLSSNSGLTASQIAAQAAMHRVSPPPVAQERKRSHPGPSPINTSVPIVSRRLSAEMSSPQVMSAGAALPYNNGLLGSNRLAATTAANVAFPSGRSPLPSPGALSQHTIGSVAEKEVKSKTSKMKLFSSRPKNLNLSKDTQGKISAAMPSPAKVSIGSNVLRNGFTNASTTSLVDPGSAVAGSLYSSANASSSTLVPTPAEKERDRERRHHFLSRPKHKLKEDPTQLPLSSAHSNSQATNPEKPQPLYSFTPDSPGVGSFAKSMSGFDLRHGGRALREKKKEEKAAAAAARLELTPTVSNNSVSGQTDAGNSVYESTLGPPSLASAGLFGAASDPFTSTHAISVIGEKMGLPGIGPDDAWPLLKARLLYVFSGEDLRTPIEDFNTLVSVHIRRCIQRKSPIVLVEDVQELLQTGFTSLAQTLRGVSDDRLVQKVVEMWIGVYANILPFLQAVFLPLDLEFKGRGVVLSVREAQDLWGAVPEYLKSDEQPNVAGAAARNSPALSEDFDVRRMTLISFRDSVILPKHETLMAIFSRLSLDSINAAASPDLSKQREYSRSDPPALFGDRPGTAGSLSPHLSSFNSQGSTLLDAASSSSGGLANRSRATSNTSAGSFGTNLPHVNSPNVLPGSFSSVTSMPAPSPPVMFTDPAKVTEMVARMLQCLYVLASCQTGDVGQGVVERLTGALKYNWLGRGRTGRDRRGWVGMKNPGGNRRSQQPAYL